VAQLHALHRVVLGTTERIVLSVARMDPQRRYREPSGVLLEAAAARGRPPLGHHGLTIPDVTLLRQQAFEPARRELRATLARWPIHASGQLDRASRRRQVPRSWRTDKRVAIDRLLTPRPPEPARWTAGVRTARSPSCPASRPIGRSRRPRSRGCSSVRTGFHGSLFHATAESFYRAHGSRFCARTQTLRDWQRAGDEIAGIQFAAFIATYPLADVEIRGAAGRRLQRDLRALLASDWHAAKTFIDVERESGPLALPIGARTVQVHGYIDRIDTTGATTLVRDLKTGRAKRRKSVQDVRPAYDVQLGLYGLVVQSKAAEWGIPETVGGSYIYPADPSGDERSFRDDFEDLATLTRSWILPPGRSSTRRRSPALRSAEARRFTTCRMRSRTATRRTHRRPARSRALR